MTASPRHLTWSSKSLCVAAVAALSLVARTSSASPQDWFTEGAKGCDTAWKTAERTSASSYSCTICNVGVTCSGNFSPTSSGVGNCTWGALSASDQNQNVWNATIQKGIALYCAGSGGSMVSAASSAGVQAQNLGTMFRALDRRGDKGKRTASPLEIGGLYEYTAFTDSGNLDGTHGFAIPFNLPVAVSGLNVDVRGNAIFGLGNGIYQYGLGLSPSTVFPAGSSDAPDAWRMLVGASVPLQFVGTSGDQINFGYGYLVGLGGLFGVSRNDGRINYGAGAGLDFHYSDGIQVPLLIALRGAYDYSSFLRLVAQPGLAMEIAALGNVGDTVRPMIQVGAEFGKWFVGYQGFFQSGIITSGFGVTYVDEVSQAAAGTLEPTPPPPPPAYRMAPPPPTYPPPAMPPAYPIPQPTPQPVPPPQQPPAWQPQTYPPAQPQTIQPAATPVPVAPQPPPAPKPAPQPTPAPPPPVQPAQPDWMAPSPSPAQPAQPDWMRPAPAPAPAPQPAPPPSQPPAWQPQTYPPAQPQPAPPAPTQPPPAPAPQPAPTPPPSAACVNVAPCVSERTSPIAPSAACQQGIAAYFSGLCPGKITCKACPVTGGAVNNTACQVFALPPVGQPGATLPFCWASDVKFKCAAEADPPACLNF